MMFGIQSAGVADVAFMRFFYLFFFLCIIKHFSGECVPLQRVFSMFRSKFFDDKTITGNCNLTKVAEDNRKKVRIIGYGFAI